MMQLTIIFVLVGMIFADPGTVLCGHSSLQTQAACTGAGYCSWSGSACTAYTVNTDCYRVDEIGACRGTSGVYISFCTPLSSLNVQYNNVCGPSGSSTIDYNYVRFPIVTTGYPDYSLTGLTIAQLTAITSTSKPDYLYQVFSVNLQTATNTQLNAILDLYAAYSSQLTASTTHPYYIEKALFQTIQNIRDDTSMTTTLKSATLVKFWALAAIYLDRLKTFSKYYQTNYYILNFAQTTFSRLYLTVNGQSFTTTFSWTQYTSNGYVQVISYPATQFGITGALSDVYYVRIITDASTTTAYIMNPFTVTYINSGGSVTVASSSLLKFITSRTAAPHALSGTTIAPGTVDNTAKKLVYTMTTPASEYTFYIAA